MKDIFDMTLAELDDYIFNLNYGAYLAKMANTHTEEQLQTEFYEPSRKAIELYDERNEAVK